MQHDPHRRARALGTSAAVALTLGAVAPALATESDTPAGTVLGTASRSGQGRATPSLEEQLAHYGDAVVPDRWLVELEGRTGAQLTADARTVGVDLTVRETYDSAWRGVSVEVDRAQVGSLAGMRGVTGLYPVLRVDRPVEPSASPEVEYAKALTGAGVADEELGLRGEGVSVGIIDSGIDYNHPDLGGSGVDDETADFPNSRVVAGYDFVGDAYDSDGDDESATVPRPDAHPDDCGGHGTHVAGIVGADGGIRGVAPEVDLGAYRIFGCDGSSDSEIIMAAMDRAAADGMDVVNMSLGASYATWPGYPTAQAADALVAKGVVVVVSQGNEGDNGTFSGGAPSVAHDVISVGSIDTSAFMSAYLTTPAGTELPFATASDGGVFPRPTQYRIVLGDPRDGCAPLPSAPGPGHAVLLQRGTCSFHAKALAAQEAGYDAAFLHNNTAGALNATVQGDREITIPVGTLTQVDGEALADELAAGPLTVTLSPDQKRFDNPTGGQQSDFSSYGLAADLTLKPDVSAPGGSIHSTVPLENGGYDTMGGTSMAAPHVAGAAALILQAHPDLDPFAVRDRLTSTADPFAWFADPAHLEPVHRQGAGLIDIPQAVTTDVRVEPGKISLGEGEAGPVTTTVTVHNDGTRERTFEIGVEHGVATTGSTSDPTFEVLDADVEFSRTSVTVPAGSSATFTAAIGEDFGIDGALYGGWITLSDAGSRFVVPFAGLSGDYQALTALDEALLAHVTPEGALAPAEPFHTYTMEGDDVPLVAFHLAYPASAVHVDVYRANADGSKGEQVHRNFRNHATLLEQGRFSALDVLAWDGTYQGNRGNDKTRKVDDGDYVLEFRVLKALGDPSNPAHWETWDSPAFTVEWGEDADRSAGIGRSPR